MPSDHTPLERKTENAVVAYIQSILATLGLDDLQVIPASSAFSTRMAAAVTLANAPGDYYRAAPSSGYGDVILTGVKQGKKNDDFHSYSLELWSSPFFDIGA